MATKPSGRLNSSSAATMPIRPIGTTLSTMNSTVEALQLDHQERDHEEQHQRHHGDDRGLRILRSPRRCRRPRCDTRPGRLALSFSTAGAERGDHGLGQSIREPRRPARSSVGTRSRRQTNGNSCSKSKRRDLAERHRASVRQRHLQGAQGRERDALLVGRARETIDQIDAVPHLRDRCARSPRCSSPRRAPASSGRAAVPGPGRCGSAPSGPAPSSRN